jgi:hypothetical protein
MIGGLLALGVAGAVAAQSGPGEPADAPVRVYTNEDLEELPPIPPLVIVDDSGKPLEIEGASERWAFVDEVLGQAYARIDADRAHWIERRRAEAEADALERIQSRPRYLLPWNAWYGGSRVGHYEGGRLRRQASRLWERPNAHLFQPITPIHARPYRTNLFRAEARFQSRSDGKATVRIGAGGAGGRRE